jgi:hypothetical protein
VGLRTGLEDVEKRKFMTLLGLELRPLGHPAHSQSLYRLSYPGSCYIINNSQMSRAVNFDVNKPHTPLFGMSFF